MIRRRTFANEGNFQHNTELEVHHWRCVRPTNCFKQVNVRYICRATENGSTSFSMPLSFTIQKRITLRDTILLIRWTNVPSLLDPQHSDEWMDPSRLAHPRHLLFHPKRTRSHSPRGILPTLLHLVLLPMIEVDATFSRRCSRVGYVGNQSMTLALGESVRPQDVPRSFVRQKEEIFTNMRGEFEAPVDAESRTEVHVDWTEVPGSCSGL